MHLQHLLFVLSATLSTAIPLVAQGYGAPVSLVTMIEAVMPGSTTCTSTGGTYVDADTNQTLPQCANATAAAPFFKASFARYNITNKWEISAALAVAGYESGDLLYRVNLNNPAQGTVNMMSPKYISLYVQSLPAISPKFSAADGVANLELVTVDEYNFASAAWFIATQCEASARAALQAGGTDGFRTYMSQCVGVDADTQPKRLDYWNRAVAAWN